MSSSIQEEKGNPVVTLKVQAEKFDFNMLRASKDNTKANSGDQAYRDIDRMDFVINKKDIDQNFINQLYAKHANLIENDENGEKNYRAFAKEVFKKMFKYAEAKIPNDSLLEELITNCNQSGYEFIYTPFMAELLSKHGLFMNVNGSSVDRKVYIDCRNPNSVKVECKTPRIPVNLSAEKISDMSFSLEFTLESQDGKDDVTYKGGKLSLTVPEKLRDYPVVDEVRQSKSLFDIIKEIFFKLIEKVFGHTNDIKIIEENGVITMAGSFGKPLKVKSTLEGVKPPINSIETSRGQ